jgi:hypothetical protein
MSTFVEALREQRWDDHRYYHHSRVNQALHLVSALCFLCGYVVLFVDPAVAAWIGWGGAMVTRQAGHFFFEPKGYDEANQATHEYKEEIKVGYNLFRKAVLHAIWLAIPAVLYLDPTFFGLYPYGTPADQFLRHTGELWLALGVGGLAFRMLQLFVQKDARTGLVWIAKILTDPFHDVMLYRKAPSALLRGELYEPTRDRSH